MTATVRPARENHQPFSACGNFEQDSRELFQMQREQIKIVLGWLQGYYLEEDAPPVVDLEKLAADELKLSGYCVANPQEDVIFGRRSVVRKVVTVAA